MQRRTLLKAGVAVGAVGAVGALGATGLALWPGDRSVTPRVPLVSLPETRFPVLVAVATRVLVGTSADPVEVAHAVDQTLAYATDEARKDLALALGLLENAFTGVLTRGQARPFTLLSAKAQDDALRAWRDGVGDLRGAYHALRKLCLAAHYATPKAFAETGYGGPSLRQPEPPAIVARGPLFVDAAAAKAEELADLPAD
jgi:hypothetical protein